MRVVVNAIPLLSPLTGVGKYTWLVCREMARVGGENVYTYYYGYYSPRLFCANQNGRTVAAIKDVVKEIPLLGRSLRLLKGAGVWLTPQRYDVYFEPNYVLLKIRAERIVAAIPDFSVYLHPEWHRREAVEFFRKNFARNIVRADRIIAISDFIRDAAVGEFGFDPEAVTTIHLGCDHEVFYPRERASLAGLRERFRLPDHFILYVGSIEPRKNLLRLLKAYRQLPAATRRDVKLVLAGFHGWDNAEVMDLLSGMQEDVSYLGYVEEPDLAGLYNLAELFIYPTLYEGFGLPPLEAMACGCPVVVSKVASLPEVCGDAAAYVDPLDIDGISGTLERLLGDVETLSLMKKRGKARAGLFSWEKTAREHLRVFSGVMAAHR